MSRLIEVIREDWYAFYILGLSIVFAIAKWLMFRK